MSKLSVFFHPNCVKNLRFSPLKLQFLPSLKKYRSINSILLLSIYLSLFFAACQNSSNETDPAPIDSTQTSNSSPAVISIQGHPISLVIITEQAIIRENPSIEATEIARLVKGDSLIFTNKISNFNTAIKLEGIAYNEPWLRVILANNKMGWVYGGCINFDARQQRQLKEKTLDQRVVTLFGQSLAKQISIYQKELQSTSTTPGFRSLYSRAQSIKDSLEHQIAIHLHASNKSQLPNFFWLNELMDGLIVHYIPEQHRYYLFRDLKRWQALSLKTTGTEDDQFIETLLASYPSDSIVFHFYGWQLPIDSTTTCSLLGSQIHSKVLEKISAALDSNSNGYFKQEIIALKQAIVDDISVSNHYWLSLESIQSELDAIIERQYPFFTTSDRVALKTRRQMIGNYTQNNIVINLFEGQAST
ncbi:SH3 domain-containing protein [Aureispira anguillae]|uniref:SH3 domain-containing protein n=1 Tax=Aureispira anguillae TaxID=2864201 RepID=A0A915YH09_9BACT|nr:SH3 domain-containing protein [Aureispira anguillae]BDS12885.1 SH3 domain-containing protein [Aureispira anguillae]